MNTTIKPVEFLFGRKDESMNTRERADSKQRGQHRRSPSAGSSNDDRRSRRSSRDAKQDTQKGKGMASSSESNITSNSISINTNGNGSSTVKSSSHRRQKSREIDRPSSTTTNKSTNSNISSNNINSDKNNHSQIQSEQQSQDRGSNSPNDNRVLQASMIHLNTNVSSQTQYRSISPSSSNNPQSSFSHNVNNNDKVPLTLNHRDNSNPSMTHHVFASNPPMKPWSQVPYSSDQHAESDDFMTYSDDDTASYLLPYRSPPVSGPINSNRYSPSMLYPSYQAQEDLSHHESYQLNEHQQMMSMGNQHYPYHHHNHDTHNHNHRFYNIHDTRGYGSISNQPKSLPNETVKNEMYFSEEGSMTSADLSSIGRHDQLYLQQQQQKYQFKYPHLLVSPSLPPENTKDLDVTTTTTPSLMMSPPSHASVSTSTSSTGSGGLPIGLRVVESPSTSNATSNAPPPIKSVRIETRNRSTTTPLSAPSSVPPLNPLNRSGSMPLQPVLSRKEHKRLARRIEIAKLIEEKVRLIRMQGHEIEDLDQSTHTHTSLSMYIGKVGMNNIYKAPSKPKDLPFAILFISHLLVISYIALRFGGLTVMMETAAAHPLSASSSSSSMGTIPLSEAASPFEYDNPFSTGISTHMTSSSSNGSFWNQVIHVDYSNALQLAFISAFYAISLAALCTAMMMILNKAFIQTIMCVTVLVCFAFGTVGLALSPYSVVPISGFIALFVSLSYCFVVWDRIPYSSTTLNTALVGMKSSVDIIILGFGFMIIAFFWTVCWIFAFLGIYDELTNDGKNSYYSWTNYLIFAAMMISYLWTLNVIKNVIHVTVSGVIYYWWMGFTESSCCTPEFQEYLSKSLTTSFGSICLGSLIVPPVYAIHVLFSLCSYNSAQTIPNVFDVPSDVTDTDLTDRSVSSTRQTEAWRSGACDWLLERCNEYGFIYGGLFNESFITGSWKAMEIFKFREYIGVANDEIINHVIHVLIVFISLGTGGFGCLVEIYDGYTFTSLHKPEVTAFLIGSWTGLVVASVFLKVVRSCVSTVSVCFSLEPYAFHKHHQSLSNEMRSKWGGFWLDETRYP